MKLVYPMRLQGAQGATEIGSLDEFITRLTAENAGCFLLGNNRLWHGGVHLSDQGGWSPQGEVRAIAEGEIVAYRLASQAAAIVRAPDPGQGEQAATIKTSPSFCLIRHHYDATEPVSGQQQTRHNPLTFYSLYMHLACDCAYDAAATRHVITGDKVCLYEAVTHTTDHAELQLIPSYQRDAAGNLTSTRRHAKQGAEVTPLSEPAEYLNDRQQRHSYQLVRYKRPMPGEPEAFFIATQFLQAEQPQRPAWMTPPEAKPERYRTASNSWVRQMAATNSPLRGLPAHSEVVTLAEPSAMIALGGGLKEFVKVQIYLAGSGTVKDGEGHVMTNGAAGECYWLAAERLGSLLPADTPEPIVRDRVVVRQQSPIQVKAGDLIGHWGEHEYAKPTANGLKVVTERAVHLEVLVSAQDESALRACLNNQGGLSGGQQFLLLPPGVVVDTFELPASGGYQPVGTFGPKDAPLPVNHSDLVTQGSTRFVKVADGQHVLIGGTTQLVSQHDWAKLGVSLLDGSQDSDGFLSAADTDHQLGSDFFASVYRQLVTDRDDDGQLTAADIQQTLHHKAQAVRKLFIKHDSEWLKRRDWSRHEQELADAPNQLAYLKAYNEQMAWADDTSSLLGEQPWFIHPAGMMELVCDRQRVITFSQLRQIFPQATDVDINTVINELNGRLVEFKLDSPTRLRHFFSQIRGEVGPGMKGKTESFQFAPQTLLSFSQYYRNHPSEAQQDGYLKDARGRIIRRADEQAIGRKHYLRLNNNRQDHPNDGYNFRGRGLIQITGYGKYNGFMSEYSNLWNDAMPDVVGTPDLVNDMPYAIRSALWFWLSYNVYTADREHGYADVVLVTAKVNGGDMGLAERQAAYQLCERVLI